jgi:hypothetical protein
MNRVGDKTVKNKSTFSITTHVLSVGTSLQHIIMPQQSSTSYHDKEKLNLEKENCLLGHETVLLD